MSLIKILAQKLKNPRTNDWIETSYVAVDDTTDNNPIVYMHGILADEDVVDGRNIREGVITDYHLASSSVGTDELANNAVVRDKIFDEAINSTKLASNAVTEDKIANGSVSANKLSSNAVTNIKLANNSVSTEKIIDKNVTKSKIDWSTIFTVTRLADNTYKITIGQ